MRSSVAPSAESARAAISRAPHDKFDQLVAKAQQFPPVVTAVVHPCDQVSLQGAVEATKQLDKLDRKKVRKHFEQHFTASRMTQDYLRIYERIVTQRQVNHKKPPLKVDDGVLTWMKLTSPSSTT